MKTSNQEIIKLIEKTKKNKEELVHITDKSKLSLEDKLKISLCKHFVRYINDKKIKTSDLALELKIPQSRVSEIVHYKITKFSIEKLIENLVKLSKSSARIREYLLLIEELAELPANKVKVNEMKNLSKGIKSINEEYLA